MGPFIYYVSTFLGFLDPPPPLHKHVLVLKNAMKNLNDLTIAYTIARLASHPCAQWPSKQLLRRLEIKGRN